MCAVVPMAALACMAGPLARQSVGLAAPKWMLVCPSPRSPMLEGPAIAWVRYTLCVSASLGFMCPSSQLGGFVFRILGI